MTKSKERVVVGMSGGVDSAVTAALLKKEGFDVHAITLTLGKEEGDEEKRWQDRSCCKVGLARFVCERLSITHEVIDLQETFRREVIDDFCDVYLAGETPNPCVRCNERIKFGSLLKIAKERGASTLATGHYARVSSGPEGRFRLFQGCDSSKDQSYFLYRLGQAQLSSIRFPLGEMRKEEVYKIAGELDLPYEEVLESQEICFVNQRDYKEVLAEMRPEANRPGLFRDRVGNILGTHKGVSFYTVGQRRGLGISSEHRLYVTEIRPKEDAVIVGEEADLFRGEIFVRDLNWIRWEAPPFPIQVEAKVRYRAPNARARVEPFREGEVRVVLETPFRGVTPGQSVVFYQGNEVVGGGIIASNRD